MFVLSKIVCSVLPFIVLVNSSVWANEKPPSQLSATISATPEWIDQQHKGIKSWLSSSSYKIDDWFGEVDPARPASANLRLIIDNQWNEHDGFQSHPRLRGKIRLPALEKKVSIVFGDERLDDESDQKITVSEHQPLDNNKKVDLKQDRKDNSSLAIRWSKWNDQLPFETDVDIGLRSYNNLFARIKLSKDWNIAENTTLYTEQMYRYSTKNKNELRSFWDLHYQHSAQHLSAWQFNLSYLDKSEHDLLWDSSIFQQHYFNQQQRLSYGIQASGYFNSQHAYVKDWDLNRWGPFVSWRQPLWREWFFVQGDLHYLNDQSQNRDHYLSTSLRLEALF